MGPKTFKGSESLSQAIKARRMELNLTIEEAANRAGVGIKTWCRYEAGGSIRQDKCKGVCKALNWRTLPSAEEDNDLVFNIDDLRDNEYWSEQLAESYGEIAAASFAIGCEILEDYINEDLDELSRRPKNSHIGEIGTSFIVDSLPLQFLTRYDYDFLYALRFALLRLKASVKQSFPLVAHSVMEELALYLVVDSSRMLLEDGDYVLEDSWDEWIFDLFDDMDIIALLYSDIYITVDNTYHFDNWMKEQFYLN